MSPKIISLPHLATSSSAQGGGSLTLRDEIIKGLKGTKEPVVPGQEPEDAEWKYKRSLPTMVLYDEKGLRLYDQITEEAPEYYLYQAELSLLKTYGPAITASMGFPSIPFSQTSQQNEQEVPQLDHQAEREHQRHLKKEAGVEGQKWGDETVGKWNGGVNGEEGLDGEKKAGNGWDVVELGAGSLRKTSHFLNAVASSLPPASSTRSPPVTYHALDLSKPELERTLEQLESANKEKYEGKIAVKGLWGDYERGLEFVRLGGLRKRDADSQTNGANATTPQATEQKKQERPKVGKKEKSDYFGSNAVTEERGRVTESPAPYESEALPSVTPAHIKAPRPAPSPLLKPRTTHKASRSQTDPKRRSSITSLNSFSLDDGPLVELQEENEHETESEKDDGPRVRGVRHSGVSLDPVGWKRSGFKDEILGMLRELRLPLWSSPKVQAHNLHLQKVSGALTNAVFFCSFNPSDRALEPTMSPLLTPKVPGMEPLTSAQDGSMKPPTLLVRVYGPSTGTLIERDEELRILHTLSTDYGLGPRIEGTFRNGRVEQFFPSHALTPKHLRDPNTSVLIARRMRELHSVDLDALGFEERNEPTVWQRIREWLPLAKKAVGALKGVEKGQEWLKKFGLDSLGDEVEQYMSWVDAREEKGKGRVFCHNDTQYGNILELDKLLPTGAPKHHQLIVIDFEYAAPNYRGFDIANHFHEWQADYHHATHAHSLSYHSPYPSMDDRERFYRAYLSVHMDPHDGHETITDETKVETTRIEALEREVRLWSPASSVFWALWGIVQGEEQIMALAKGGPAQVDFDYLAYALGRIEMFRKEAAELGAFSQSQVGGSNMAQDQDKPVHFLFLGSSLGNFTRDSAASFLASLPMRPGSSDSLLLGLDGRPSPSDGDSIVDGHLPHQPMYEDGRRKIEVAYDDPKGKTRDFILHGVEVAAEALELEDAVEDSMKQPIKRRTSSMRRESWSYKSRYNVKLGRHEAYIGSNEDQQVTWKAKDGRRDSIDVVKGELLNMEWSLKYSMTESLELFDKAGLVPVDSWQDKDSNYRLWLLRRPPFYFPVQATAVCAKEIPANQSRFETVPSRDEWHALWKTWDAITLQMIPEQMLHEKPIDLRHKCLFYLGHIPTFLDIHLTRLTNGKHSEPEHFKYIFERGIDPHVDDPNQCHDHSAVPENDEDWPALQEILEFRDRVRRRLLSIYDEVENGKRAYNRRTARILWMTYEHEAFHMETLLFMLIQSPKTLPPPGFARPQWAELARKWDERKDRSVILDIEAGQIALGHDDKESEDKLHLEPSSWSGHEFGWDNENPQTAVDVKAFKVDSLPVTNGEYWKYMQQNDIKKIPGSWYTTDGVPDVKTLYGPVPMAIAQHWPLMASGKELASFAKWKGGRLPTESELRMLWKSDVGPRPAGLSSNVGVKRWHPVPPTNTRIDSCGRILHGHNGGVWEWTSTKFASYPDFETSEVYPGYSTDFYDDIHLVVLGGSYVTIPRLACRSSLRNFFQDNYPFAWNGGRVVYDK